jgi:hypothetical protein
MKMMLRGRSDGWEDAACRAAATLGTPAPTAAAAPILSADRRDIVRGWRWVIAQDDTRQPADADKIEAQHFR